MTMTTRIYILSALLLFAGCLQAAAQDIRISGFTEGPLPSPDQQNATSLLCDTDGKPCAILRIETGLKGLTFDAGLAGVVDISYGEDAVTLWVPSEAGTISVAHPTFGAIRDWSPPVSLAPGHIYSMKLDVFHPKPTPVPTPRQQVVPQRQPVRIASPVPQEGPLKPCNHFIDAFSGSVLEEGEFADCHFFGLRYTYIGKRLGPYVAASLSGDEDYTFSGGLAVRLGEGTGNPDWHVYGGAGIIDGCGLLGEVGGRVAWLSERKVSRWDFGVGCQVWGGGVMPTVEVGLCIWGIPVCFCLGLALCAI